MEGGLDVGVAIGLFLIPLCCGWCGAWWLGERFEVIWLRSIASIETEANVNGWFRKRRRTAYEDQSLLFLKDPVGCLPRVLRYHNAGRDPG